MDAACCCNNFDCATSCAANSPIPAATFVVSGSSCSGEVIDGDYTTSVRTLGFCGCVGDCALMFYHESGSGGAGEGCICHDQETGVTAIAIDGSVGSIYYEEYDDPDGSIFCGATGVVVHSADPSCGTVTWN